VSLDAYQWAWSQQMGSSMKLTLLSLADRADEFHRCYPSIERLAKDTCLNRKTVMSNLKKLTTQGFISIAKTKTNHGQFKRNIYTLMGVVGRENEHQKGAATRTNNHPPKLVHGDENHVPTTTSQNRDTVSNDNNALQDKHSLKNEPLKAINPCPKNGTPKNALSMSQNRDTNLPVNSTLSNKKNNKEKNWVIPIWVNQIAWSEFEQHRKILKPKSWTNLARTKLANLLKDFNHEDQQKMIDKSIIGGYPSIYPLDKNYDKNSPSHENNFDQNKRPESNHARSMREAAEACE